MSVVDTCGTCNLHLSIVESAPGLGQLFSGTTFGVIAAGMSLATNAIATGFTAYRAMYVTYFPVRRTFDR